MCQPEAVSAAARGSLGVPTAEVPPRKKRKGILRNPADVRTCVFMSSYYGCMLTLWLGFERLRALGSAGLATMAAVYVAQCFLAMVAVT